MKANGQPVQILLVEDNPSDVELTREALKDGKVANDLSVVMDGEAAMDFLYTRNEYADARRPDLVILDLNLPKKDGREILVEVKNDESLREIPVIVLTTSSSHEDVEAAYRHYVNAYIQKPIDFEAFIRAVRSLEDFWLSIVKLPSRNGSG